MLDEPVPLFPLPFPLEGFRVDELVEVDVAFGVGVVSVVVVVLVEERRLPPPPPPPPCEDSPGAEQERTRPKKE